MVKETKIGDKTLYICDACGLGFLGIEDADKCEKWCTETKSCSLEITRKAVYFPRYPFPSRELADE